MTNSVTSTALACESVQNCGFDVFMSRLIELSGSVAIWPHPSELLRDGDIIHFLRSLRLIASTYSFPLPRFTILPSHPKPLNDSTNSHHYWAEKAILRRMYPAQDTRFLFLGTNAMELDEVFTRDSADMEVSWRSGSTTLVHDSVVTSRTRIRFH